MSNKKRVESVRFGFEECRTILTMLGDENRQNIIISLLGTTKDNGLRVGEITKLSHLSRLAVSHHLQILKSEELIGMKRVGTKHYYYMNATSSVMKLTELVNDISECIKENEGECGKNKETIKIHVLHTGHVCVDIGVPIKQKNSLAVTGFFRSKKHRI